MQTLSQKMQVNYPLCNESLYDSVFNKLTLYNRNVKYINEGYTKLPTHITFSKDEQQAVSEMLFALQFNYLENYFVETYENNINESLADIKQKFKEAIEKGKNSVEEFFKDLIDKIPDSVKEAYQKLGELAKKGISNAKDLLTKLYKIFSTLGETLSEALEKLGIYKKSVVNEIDESEFIENIPDELLPKDESKRKVAKFLISRVHQGIQNKEVISYAKINDTKDVNEGKVGKTAAVVGLGILSQFSLLPVVLIAGGYLTYKTLKFIGPKLSDKLEPYLLSDKTKEFVSKLYDNPISRYGLGLQKNSDIDKEDTKLQKFFKICKSILVNLVISYLISSFVGLFVSSLFTGALGAVGVSILVASILAGRNIMSTVFNRVLNFKKETTVKTKNGEKKVTNNFFDVVTLVSILASLMSVILQIPAVKEWFADVFKKLANTGLANNASASEIKDRIITRGYTDSNGNFVKLGDCKTITTTDNGDTIMTDIQTHEIFRMDKTGRIFEMNYSEIAKSHPEMLPDGLALFKNTPEVLENVKSWSKPICLYKDVGDKLTTLNGQVIHNIKENTEYLISFAITNDGKMHAVITVKDTYIDFVNNIQKSMNPNEDIWKLSDNLVSYFDELMPKGDGVQTFTFAEKIANMNKKELIEILHKTIKSERGK